MRSTRILALALLALGAAGASSGCADVAPPQVPPGSIPVPPAPRAAAAPRSRAQDEARAFLAFYDGTLGGLTAQLQEVEWKASTDVSDAHAAAREGAESVMAGFTGSAWIIQRAKELLGHEAELDARTARELRWVLLDAAAAPATDRALLAKRIAAEARQSATQDGFTYCLDPGATAGKKPCARPATAGDLDQLLQTSKNLAERENAWRASKEIGVPLRSGLVELRELRNATARELGYADFQALQVADYGMSTAEMMSLLDASLAKLRPLQEKLQCFARRSLAKRFGKQEPKLLPAHWVGNRWAQSWPGLVPAVDLSALFAKKEPAWFAKTAEQYYVSMGFPALPGSFWEKSDLFPVPKGDARKKNSHASAWHMDLEHDVRSLMSIRPTEDWFLTAHHELGHIYYYLAYTRPEVPPLLRRGMNRAFHEAVGELVSLSVRQEPYLRQLGLISSETKFDAEQALLDDALSKGPVFFAFAAGTMSHFENDLYAGKLDAGSLNARWWEHVARFQGVAPPSPRDEKHCDACTKTHVNDDAAQYYDYALATLIKHQLHEHLCKAYVHADPRACTYAGNRQVGEALSALLALGATRDWREVLREATGEAISADAMLRYYAPVEKLLDRELAGASCGW
jgi:peptidyl-dipeptidase A